ncbi:L-idonate 5-dehydrogenase [Martelella alba]|uniref:Zinc-binding dehydrogenase n=1 Tax=Martelella alba TaxID=2590451 RepID=A0ABY2SQN4_9HYPH|nr:L-idonate 5-dehydrogenase [Martelella alba]TKI08525.1 zinc-binding dehydrogenase [Martelella alba]
MSVTNALTCKACFAHGAKDVRWEDREIHFTDKDVLVKVASGGICGSDIHYYLHGRAGMSILKQPMVLGHEFVGVVESAPAGSSLRVGQRVAINPSQPCNHCEQCLSGRQNLCASMRFMGSAQFNPHVDGGFSQYVVASEQQCIPYNAAVPAPVMAFSEPLSVAIHAVNVAGTLVGKKVLVIGAGPIGCLIIAAARSAGAGEIVASDVSARCLDLAKAMGAEAAFNPAEPGGGDIYRKNRGYFDVTFEVSGNAAAIASTVDYTRPAGKVVQVGMGSATADFPIMPMLVKEITLTGSFRFIGEFATAVKWLEDGRIDPTPLISATFAPDNLEKALITAADKTQSAKVLMAF